MVPIKNPPENWRVRWDSNPRLPGPKPGTVDEHTLSVRIYPSAGTTYHVVTMLCYGPMQVKFRSG